MGDANPEEAARKTSTKLCVCGHKKTQHVEHTQYKRQGIKKFYAGCRITDCKCRLFVIADPSKDWHRRSRDYPDNIIQLHPPSGPGRLR